ncbi:DUF29 domain-containing protein [Roseomonas sp. AR75]|uniref:DUF29 domain-containing protein n=1 Tax=Roseomonas sp. AR75 TaxID=2562311 RepID=UPI001485BB9B|nr:DUF29 domain-containing protein [Roseomonas sp. AR75]
MPDDLYDRDILAWSQAQAERLRRLAAGERVNDLDWTNVIEEIEEVGRSQLLAVESLLLQALVHAMKAAGWPDQQAVRHWTGEIVAFLVQARRRYAPSMAQALDLDSIHADALRIVHRADIPGEPLALTQAPPLTLQELLDPDLAPETLIARLREDAA